MKLSESRYDGWDEKKYIKELKGGKKIAFHTLNSQTYLAIKAVQKNCGGFVQWAPSEHIEAYAEDKDLIEQGALPGL